MKIVVNILLFIVFAGLSKYFWPGSDSWAYMLSGACFWACIEIGGKIGDQLSNRCKLKWRLQWPVRRVE